MGNNPSIDIGSTHPVQRVSWTDAHLFIKKLTQKTGYLYRLPSEAEWEYATRAGTTTQFFWGDDDTQILDYVWSYRGTNYIKDFQPVGLKKPNQFGLFDLQSSLNQWTQDCWHENYIGAPTDGSAWTTGCSGNLRMLRGGSWNYFPWGLRSVLRGRHTPDRRELYVGFRLAMTLLNP